MGEQIDQVPEEKPGKDVDAIMAAVREVQLFPIVDERPSDEILYDTNGMPG